MAEEKPRYDFYENALFLDDPIQADLNRKKRTCAPKIGTEPRVSDFSPTIHLVGLKFKPRSLIIFVIMSIYLSVTAAFCADATEQSGAEPGPAVLPQGQARAAPGGPVHVWVQAGRGRSEGRHEHAGVRWTGKVRA